jgi:hypothetical protein|nr:MAG TPA: hypothetical protein [Caudoviricetes sp.]
MYKVIKGFFDLEDYKDTKSGRVYHEYVEGDEYPRAGVDPGAERVALLASDDNLQGEPLIESVGAPTDETEPEPGDSDETSEGEAPAETDKKTDKNASEK